MRERCDLVRERQYLVLADAALLRLASLVHLDQHVERRREVRPLLVQARRDLRAIDGVHPLKIFGDDPSLVGL